MKYYVTMTDKFLSGWGQAQDKIAKYVNICDSYEEAEIVAENARNRSDQKYVNISSTKPYYNNNRYLVMYKTKQDMPKWYTKNAF